MTAMKIYQHFGPACTDILRQSPFRLCEISGFGFRRVDTIIRKSGGDPHAPARIHGAMICALENARQHGHLYLEVNTLIAESLQFLNEPIPLPQMQVRRAEVCADALPQRSCVRADGHAPAQEYDTLSAIHQPESAGISACGNEG